MSDHSKKETHDTPQAKEVSSDNRKVVKKMVIGALAATAGVPLTSWEAMAHGNRSSHSAAVYRSWSPDAYTLMRQELTMPDAEVTKRLRGMYDELEALERNLGVDALREDTSAIQMREDIRTLENSVRISPMTRQVIEFAEQKDVDAISATLASIGTPEDVLDNSVWVLLDIGHQNDDGVLSTDRSSAEYSAIAEAVLDFAINRLNDLKQETGNPFRNVHKVKVANVLHNITSFSLPDIGEPSKDALAVARRAMLLQLALRKELGQEVEIVRALNLAGRLFTATNEPTTAKRYLDEAENMASKIGYRAGLAYNKAYRAELQDRTDSTASAVLRDEARVLAESVRDAAFEDITYLIAFLDRQR
ncbi:hypothetical protein [Parasedimentitalea maritima]|uniref:Uncharacterized protein n=1 Tax=Parasedimentitalea maritima TaxID=2578117 RepID=A0A6A4RAL8_9RHOB|nr:hypothetical protein [Zongyanglinia marina]KAE9624742.1 hypothetical protein GP644_23190 [Zongyanglinia marina]